MLRSRGKRDLPSAKTASARICSCVCYPDYWSPITPTTFSPPHPYSESPVTGRTPCPERKMDLRKKPELLASVSPVLLHTHISTPSSTSTHTPAEYPAWVVHKTIYHCIPWTYLSITHRSCVQLCNNFLWGPHFLSFNSLC